MEGEQARKAPDTPPKALLEGAEPGPRTGCAQKSYGTQFERAGREEDETSQSKSKQGGSLLRAYTERRNLESLDVSTTAALHENCLMYIRK